MMARVHPCFTAFGVLVACGGRASLFETDGSGSTTGPCDDPAECRCETGETSIGCRDMPLAETCHAQEDLAPIACNERHPRQSTSFTPQLQWTFAGIDDMDDIVATPTVANLTDDNADGAVDLCDVPDVIVVVHKDDRDARLVVLDGATGVPHFTIDHIVSGLTSPAIGDLDNDGLPRSCLRSLAKEQPLH